jgi:hypothetical protein
MKLFVRAVVLIAVFAGVGFAVAKAVIDHAAVNGAAGPEVRLAGAMAGLFAGGLAVAMSGLGMVLLRRK